MSLPREIERTLEEGPEQFPERRENPWRTIWPSEARVPGLPVLEFHEEPLPPYLYGPYRKDVAKRARQLRDGKPVRGGALRNPVRR